MPSGLGGNFMKSLDQIFDTEPSCIAFNLAVMYFLKSCFFPFSAFFPLLVILHFVQLFFYTILISQPWFIATVFGNTLWLVAIGYYLYITFLGYHSLHILDRTKIFLYPFVPLVIIFLASLIVNWNITQSLMNFYHFRVL